MTRAGARAAARRACARTRSCAQRDLDLLVGRRPVGRAAAGRAPSSSSSPTGRSRLVTTRETSRSSATCSSVQAGGVGDLLVGRLAPELGRQLALDAAAILRSRWATLAGRRMRAPAVGEAALDRLADPQRRVGGEAEALAPVELLGGADQPEHALLDEVEQASARRCPGTCGRSRRRGAGCALIRWSLAARSPRSMRLASSISSAGVSSR